MARITPAPPKGEEISLEAQGTANMPADLAADLLSLARVAHAQLVRAGEAARTGNLRGLCDALAGTGPGETPLVDTTSEPWQVSAKWLQRLALVANERGEA